MQQSLFLEYVAKWFPGLAIKAVETLNGADLPLPYYHRRFLRKEYSTTGTWTSVSAAFTLVMADIVAMDSSIPLKKRDSAGRATGDIPKMGLELKLNEKQFTDLKVLQSQNVGGQLNNTVIARIFADVPRVIGGIYEKLEAMFLEGFSSGVTLIEEPENVGTGIRLDYGYLAGNKFGVTTVWSNVASKPFDDIERARTKASLDGRTFTRVMMDKSAFDYMAATTQAKELYAFSLNFIGTTIPAPDLAAINTMTQRRFGYTIEVVDRAVRYERDGNQTAQKPWKTGAVVMYSDPIVGSLIWSRLAEQDAPVPGVTYQNVDDFIMVSKFSQNRPSFGEFTNSQARVCPVISGVESIYTIDTLTVQA